MGSKGKLGWFETTRLVSNKTRLLSRVGDDVRSLTFLFGSPSAVHTFSLTPALSRWARECVRPPRVGGSTSALRRSSANPLSQRESDRLRENGHFRPRHA